PVGRVTPCAPPRQLHMLILYDRRSCAKVNHHVALIFPRDGIATRRSAERIEVRVRAYLCSEPLDYRLLIQQFYRIAFVHHAFHHDRTVNARHTFVSLRYFLEYLWRFLGSIWIECDHHAACVAFQDPDDDFRPDPQRSTDKIIFGESATGHQVHVNVCAETPLVDWRACLFSQLSRRLQTKDRYGTAIGQRAL